MTGEWGTPWERAMRYTNTDVLVGDCWEWVGHKDRQGYGRLNVAGIPRLAHQVTYEANFGPVPDGLELDHFICQNRACVHPLHLEAVTHAENMRRARRPSCKRGHSRSTENSYLKANGSTECLTCMRERARQNSRRRYAMKKGSAA